MYTVTLKGGAGADRILDVAGNALAADYVWSFTTGDFTAPTVVSTSPASNATSININTVITAEVSEALNAASVTNTSVLLTERRHIGTGYPGLHPGQYDHHADTIGTAG